MKPETHQILRQVRVLDPLSNTDQISDILIQEGKIQAIEPQISFFPPETEEIDAQGLVIGPGLMDLYSHSGEPGHEERENLSSFAAAAAAGGFTQVAILPDTSPSIDNPATVSLIEQKIQALTNLSLFPWPHFQMWGSITLNQRGEQMTELADLADSGVIGFTDSRPLDNLALLRRVLEYLKPWEKTVALVANNRLLRGNGVMREGIASISYGLPGNPSYSESAALAAILELVRAINTPVHLMRISTQRGVELIAEAKAQGLPITASTHWMQLLLNTQAVKSYDPNLRLEPPLGNEEDQKALIEGVKTGSIDAIAVDHTPYTYEEKTVSFGEAPAGAIGLELVLPLLWQQFVTTEEWSALTLWEALSVNPRLCLQQTPIRCQCGEKAELVLFAPQATWTVKPELLKSLSYNTPWLNKQISGKVIRIWNSY